MKFIYSLVSWVESRKGKGKKKDCLLHKIIYLIKLSIMTAKGGDKILGKRW